MKHFRTMLVIMTLGALVVQLSASAGLVSSSEVVALFGHTVKQLAQASSLFVEVGMKVDRDRQGETSASPVFSVSGRIQLQDASNAYMYLKTDRQEIELFQNAQDRVVYDKVADTYRTLPPERDRYALIRAMMSGPVGPACAWLADLLSGKAAIDADTLSVALETPATGTPLYRLSFEHAGRPLAVQLEQETGEIRGFRMDGPDGIRIAVSLSGWTDAPAPESAFVFVPPATAKAVKREDTPRRTDPLAGKPAPDFSLDLLDGGQMSLSSHRGRDIVVLDFWASWCGPCRMAMPMIEEVMETLAGRPVVLYAVNLRESPDRARAFLEKAGLTLRVPLDRNGEVARQYGVTSIPRMVVIGKDGSIRAGFTGMNPSVKEELAQIIGELLGE